MAGKTIREFLKERERELAQQAVILRDHLAWVETELEEAHRIMDQLGPEPEKGSPPVYKAIQFGATQTGFEFVKHAMQQEADIAAEPRVVPAPENSVDARRPIEQMTIKDLVVSALKMRSPQGLKASELRSYIRQAYGREIESSSLRPQLARLKAEGRIEQNPLTDAWSLTAIGHFYDHPSRWPVDE